MQSIPTRNNTEKKLSGQGKKQLTEYHILLQDILHLSSDGDFKQEMMNKHRKVIADDEKQIALDVRGITMKKLDETRQITEEEGPEEKKSKRRSVEPLYFLRQKLECNKELREKELNLKRKESPEFLEIIM